MTKWHLLLKHYGSCFSKSWSLKSCSMGEDGWGDHFVSLFTRKVLFPLQGTLIFSSGKFLLGRNMVGATMLFLTWENPFLPNRHPVWENCPKISFFIHFVHGRKNKLKMDWTLYPWLKGGGGRILTIRSLFFLEKFV